MYQIPLWLLSPSYVHNVRVDNSHIGTRALSTVSQWFCRGRYVQRLALRGESMPQELGPGAQCYGLVSWQVCVPGDWDILPETIVTSPWWMWPSTRS